MKKPPTLTYARVSNPADVDYWSKLSPEDAHWLRRFNRAEHFGRGDTTNPLPDETRRLVDRNRNALRRDCYSRMAKADDAVPDQGPSLEETVDTRRELYASVQILIELAAQLPPMQVGASGNFSGPPTEGLHADGARQRVELGKEEGPTQTTAHNPRVANAGRTAPRGRKRTA